MQVRRNARLAELTTLAVGGPAERLVEVTDADELVEAVRAAELPSALVTTTPRRVASIVLGRIADDLDGFSTRPFPRISDVPRSTSEAG